MSLTNKIYRKVDPHICNDVYEEIWETETNSNKILILLLCERKFNNNSLFYLDYLPKDIFIYISQLSNLYGKYISLYEIPNKIIQHTDKKIIWELIHSGFNIYSSYYINSEHLILRFTGPSFVECFECTIMKIPEKIWPENNDLESIISIILSYNILLECIESYFLSYKKN